MRDASALLSNVQKLSDFQQCCKEKGDGDA